jgi:hypothetical protein
VLLLVIAANFCNSERIVFLVRWYGAATTKVLLSLEIVTTWLMAVSIFYLCQALHEPILAGVGMSYPHSVLSPAKRLRNASVRIGLCSLRRPLVGTASAHGFPLLPYAPSLPLPPLSRGPPLPIPARLPDTVHGGFHWRGGFHSQGMV